MSDTNSNSNGASGTSKLQVEIQQLQLLQHQAQQDAKEAKSQLTTLVAQLERSEVHHYNLHTRTCHVLIAVHVLATLTGILCVTDP
jgi:hypothetical protein